MIQGKISTAFLEYAEPIMNAVPDDASLKQIEEVLQFPATVWNAVVLEDSISDGSFMKQLRRCVARQPIPAAMVEQLIQRKRALFGDDLRLVGNFNLFHDKKGVLGLRVDAHDPNSFLASDMCFLSSIPEAPTAHLDP